MNEFQSPYIDGDVISAQDGAPSLHGFENSQPVAVPAQKIQGCSRSASECLQKTKQLAHEFNHGTYCAAHLVLAMTLVENGNQLTDFLHQAFRNGRNALYHQIFIGNNAVLSGSGGPKQAPGDQCKGKTLLHAKQVCRRS